jgi:hypothetical protein
MFSDESKLEIGVAVSPGGFVAVSSGGFNRDDESW